MKSKAIPLKYMSNAIYDLNDEVISKCFTVNIFYINKRKAVVKSKYFNRSFLSYKRLYQRGPKISKNFIPCRVKTSIPVLKSIKINLS